MRLSLNLLTILPFFQKATAQVGIGVTTPNTLAQLQVQSTSKGMLVPRMTLAHRNSISIPGDAEADGLLIYQTDETPGFYFYNGASWVPFTNNPIVKSGGTNFTNSLRDSTS